MAMTFGSSTVYPTVFLKFGTPDSGILSMNDDFEGTSTKLKKLDRCVCALL